MALDFDTQEDMSGGGGNYLDTEGTFHFLLTNVVEGKSSNDKSISGFYFDAEVRAGTAKGCEGQVSSQTIFLPDLSGDAKQIEIARKLNAAFLLATNLIEPQQLGQRVRVEVAESVGRQIVVRLERAKKRDETGELVDTKFLRIRYDNVYHVDDPRVASVPKDADSLSIIEPKFRRPKEWFGWAEGPSKAEPKPPVSDSAFAGLV